MGRWKVRKADASEAGVIKVQEKKIVNHHKALRDTDTSDDLSSHLSLLQTQNIERPPWSPATLRFLCPSSFWPPDTEFSCAGPCSEAAGRALGIQEEIHPTKHEIPSSLLAPSLHSNKITSQQSKGKAPSYAVLWHRWASKTSLVVDLLDLLYSHFKSKVIFPVEQSWLILLTGLRPRDSQVV